jgi:hypothetical protein
MLHLGNSDVAGSNPAIVFGKRLADNTGSRNAFISYTDTFIFCIGDNGNTNGSSNLITQLGIHYAAPGASLVIGINGYVAMQYGYGMDISEVAEMMQKRFALKTILKGYKHCISSLGRLRWPRRCKQMQQNIIN